MGLFTNAFKIGAGVISAQVMFLAIGLLFLILGMYMLNKARKNRESTVPAYIVMGLGVVMGLGLGAGMFFENITENLN